MGFLGKQKAQSNVSDATGMNSLLGSMLGGQPQQNQSLITTLLDADGDGSILDDVAGMVWEAVKRKVDLEAYLEGFSENNFYIPILTMAVLTILSGRLFFLYL